MRFLVICILSFFGVTQIYGSYSYSDDKPDETYQKKIFVIATLPGNALRDTKITHDVPLNKEATEKLKFIYTKHDFICPCGTGCAYIGVEDKRNFCKSVSSTEKWLVQINAAGNAEDFASPDPWKRGVSVFFKNGVLQYYGVNLDTIPTYFQETPPKLPLLNRNTKIDFGDINRSYGLTTLGGYGHKTHYRIESPEGAAWALEVKDFESPWTE